MAKATSKSASAAKKTSKKVNVTNTTRKGATKRTIRNQYHPCIDLKTKTQGLMKNGETRMGTLHKEDDFLFEFKERALLDKHEWECQTSLAKDSNGRISANANGVYVHMYFKSYEFEDQFDLAERIMEQAESLCGKLLKEDVQSIMKELQRLRP